MGTLNDDELHKMVQDAFDEYRPDTSPKDWQVMQQKLWKAKLWKWAVTTATTTVVVATLVIGFYKLGDKKETDKTLSVASSTSVPSSSSQPPPPLLELSPTTSQPLSVPPLLVLSPTTHNDIVGDNTNNGENGGDSKTHSSPLLVLSPTTSAKIPLQFLKSQPLDFLKDFTSLENRELSLKSIKIPKAVPDFMSDLGTTYELTPFQVLERKKDQWKNVVVVCDLTSSMYVYSKQVIQWFEKNQDNPNIKGVVFFTDCDSLGHQTDGNLPGKMFVSRSLSPKNLLPIAHEAIKNTEENLDTDENNMEALVYASRVFEDATDIVLIADNSSGIKDFYLWPLVKKPVHVIVCGETYEEYQAIQPDLMKLVKFTKGSLHTLEDDINDLNNLPNNSWIRVGGRYYQYRFGVFFPSENTRRPSQIPLGRP